MHSILYHSSLAGPDALLGIANIAQVARKFTAANDISGLLMFDGQRFCEYLEGPDAPMAALVARIRGDARHQHMHILHESFDNSPRLFSKWSMAYVTDESEPLLQIITLSGRAAMDKVLSLSGSFDTA